MYKDFKSPATIEPFIGEILEVPNEDRSIICKENLSDALGCRVCAIAHSEFCDKVKCHHIVRGDNKNVFFKEITTEAF